MADGAELSIDTAQLTRDGDRMIRGHLAAGTTAVATATKRLERALEDATRSAVPGRLWRAWASDAYPRRGAARNPTGVVFVNGGERSRSAMTFWTQPGAIRGRGGQFLAIPLPAAGPRGRDRMLTPFEWESAHNTDLEFVPRPGRAPLLVAQTGKLSSRGTFRRLSVKRLKAGERGNAWIPIFVLLPVVKFRNAFAIEPLVAAAEADLVSTFLAETGKL